MKLRHFYLILCAIALILPFSQYIPFYFQYGPDTILFVQQALASYPSRFVSLDVIMAVIVFVVFAHVEGHRLKMPYWWVPILAVFVVHLCFAFPLFLYMREIQIDKAGRLKKA